MQRMLLTSTSSSKVVRVVLSLGLRLPLKTGWACSPTDGLVTGAQSASFGSSAAVGSGREPPEDVTESGSQVHDGDDQGEAFLDDPGITREVAVDDGDEADDSLHTFTRHNGELYTVGCSPTYATLVATEGGDDKAFLWGIGHGDWALEFQGLTCMTTSSDSSFALIGARDGSVRLVNISSVVSSLVAHADSDECEGLAPRPLRGLQLEAWIRSLLYGISSIFLSVPCDYEDGVTCLRWVGASRFLATGSLDGNVRVWDSLPGDCVRTFDGHSDAIQSVLVSANEEFVVSVLLDETTLGSLRLLSFTKE